MFFRKRNDDSYIVLYKEEKDIVKELMKDSRVANCFFNGSKKLTVRTKPLTPKGFGFDKIMIGPIGTFKIIIEDEGDELYYRVMRIENTTGERETLHIFSADSDSRRGIEMCLGNIEDEIDTLKTKKDYYYLAKRFIDLCEDIRYDTNFDTGDFIGYIFKWMKQYNKSITTKKQHQIFCKRLDKVWDAFCISEANKDLKEHKLKCGDRVKDEDGDTGILIGPTEYNNDNDDNDDYPFPIPGALAEDADFDRELNYVNVLYDKDIDDNYKRGKKQTIGVDEIRKIEKKKKVKKEKKKKI